MLSMPESGLIAFYRNEGVDHRRRSLRDVRGFDLDHLEHTHDFIQWLFPLPEPSSANAFSPLLSREDMNRFRSDPSMQAELLRSFTLMLRFFGLALMKPATPGTLTVIRADDFAERCAVWLYPGSHNFLRITRILRSLTLLGCPAHAAALLQCLDDVYSSNRDAVGLRTMHYWRSAVVLGANGPTQFSDDALG